jgi:hypothetical protein
MTDESNCGACDNVCGMFAECVNGACACVAGYADCDGVCINLQWDDNNCGACRLSCEAGEKCTRGGCSSVYDHTVGVWHMNEDGAGTTTLFDSSGFDNHLVRADASEDVVGQPGYVGFAVGGWAHVTNIGDDRDRYFANTSLLGTWGMTELTFEFWLKLPADGVRNDPNPFGLGDDDDDRFRIDDSGSLEYDNEGIQGHLSTGVLPFGTWNHVALTWDSAYARLWLNGELADQEPSTGVSAITFLRLGGQHAGNANFSGGYVDEARLSDVVRYTSTFEPPHAPFGDAESTFLTNLVLSEAEVGFGVLSIWAYAFSDCHGQHCVQPGDPIILHGVEYPNAIMAHADSKVAYDLPGGYNWLRATIGIEEHFDCGDGAVFVVMADGGDAYISDLMTWQDTPVEINVAIKGAEHLVLLTLQQDDVEAGIREPRPSSNRECDWTIWGDLFILR